MGRFFPALALLALIGFAFAESVGATPEQMAFEKLPPGTEVLAPGANETLAKSLGRGSKYGRAEVVAAENLAGVGEAVRIVTAQKPEHPYGYQASVPIALPVAKGDALLATFWGRAVQVNADEESRLNVVFEVAGEPYTKSVSFALTPGREWQQFFVPFVCVGDYAKGAAALRLQAGFDPQTVEVAALRLIDYAHSVEVHALPFTPTSYRGRAADASWRKVAAERIERERKGDLNVVVLNAAGQPVPEAKVTVRMQRHAFAFGSAVAGAGLLGQQADDHVYRALVVRSFNKVVLENDLKWPQYEWHPETAHRAVEWLRSMGLPVRGHNLLWPNFKYLPKDLATLKGEPGKLRTRILDHVRTEVAAFKGQLAEWDVVNEPVTNTDIQKVLGDEIIADVFKLTHEIDPQPRLFINDYSILSTGGTDTTHQDGYFTTIEKLLAAGAPVQGIGLQGHFDEQLTPIPRLWEILDRFAKFGLPIQITEHDVDVWDEALQADYTRDFMTAIFAHPATIGLVTWGFWEKRHWVPSAAYWRADWTLRPAGQRWFDLVFREWWTNADLTTDASGGAKVRGFLGDYQIEVASGGQTRTLTASLGKGGLRLEVRLEK